MELNKSKYTQREVLEILKAYKNEYEKRIAEHKTIIANLNQEIKELNAVKESLQEKERVLVATLLRAEKTALDLEKSAKEQYALEVERLKKFIVSWNDYFEKLKEKYPLYSPTQKALDLREQVENASESDAKSVIDGLESALESEKGEKFDPKTKIKDYIAATGVNGFNLDDVLNPGELQLEEICKELGLIDSNE